MGSSGAVQLAGYLRDRFPFTARVTIADNGSTDRTWRLRVRCVASCRESGPRGWSSRGAGGRCGRKVISRYYNMLLRACLPGGIGGFGGGGLGGNTQVSSALAALLERDASQYKWVAATEGSEAAAPLELATGRCPVPRTTLCTLRWSILAYLGRNFVTSYIKSA